MSRTHTLLDLDPAVVRRARSLARKAAAPVVEIAKSHTTVSVERATLRLAGLSGPTTSACRGSTTSSLLSVTRWASSTASPRRSSTPSSAARRPTS